MIFLEYKEDKFYFIILLIYSFLSTLKMTTFCLSGGILNPDISLYLISALKYAGMDYFNIANPLDLFFTPIISFLSSLFFRIGIVDVSSIIIVTAIFGFFGYIGLYILLRNRFNPILSLTGVIIYGSFSIVLFNLAKGLIDIPAISISIWILIFAILAINKHPKYYLITFPLFTIGFFVKYIVGFIIPIIFLYYLMNKDVLNLICKFIYDKKSLKQDFFNYLNSKEFHYIIISLICSIILAVIICKTLILNYGGSLIFFQQSVDSLNGGAFSQGAINFNPDRSFYFDSLPNILYQRHYYTFELFSILLVIFLFGILIKVINIIKNKQVIQDLFVKNDFPNYTLDKILIFTNILSIFGIFAGFIYFSNHMISNICIIISIVICYVFLQRLELNTRNNIFFLLFFGYFMIYFIFISLYNVKVYRYILPIIPPLIYFIIWGLENIVLIVNEGFDDNELFKSKLFDNNYKDTTISKRSMIIPVVIILIFLISTIIYIGPMQLDRNNELYDDVLKQGFVSDLTDACEFIKNHDPNYHSKTFASYIHHERTIRWHLKVPVTALNEKDPNLEDFDNATYIILKFEKDFKNYHKIKNCGDFNIYYHN